MRRYVVVCFLLIVAYPSLCSEVNISIKQAFVFEHKSSSYIARMSYDIFVSTSCDNMILKDSFLLDSIVTFEAMLVGENYIEEMLVPYYVSSIWFWTLDGDTVRVDKTFAILDTYGVPQVEMIELSATPKYVGCRPYMYDLEELYTKRYYQQFAREKDFILYFIQHADFHALIGEEEFVVKAFDIPILYCGENEYCD